MIYPEKGGLFAFEINVAHAKEMLKKGKSAWCDAWCVDFLIRDYLEVHNDENIFVFPSSFFQDVVGERPSKPLLRLRGAKHVIDNLNKIC